MPASRPQGSSLLLEYVSSTPATAQRKRTTRGMAMGLIGAIAFELVMLVSGGLVGPGSDPVAEFAEVRGAIKGAIVGGVVLVVVTSVVVLATVARGPAPMLRGVARGLLLALAVVGLFAAVCTEMLR